MSKVRVYVLAKELNIASADILFYANDLGIQVKTASSGLSEDEVGLIKLELESKMEVNQITEESEESVTIQKKDKEEVTTKSKDEEPAENIEIIELDEKSTPLDIARLLEKDSTKVVEDLLKMGLLTSIESPLKNQDIEKLLESYGYIVDIKPLVEVTRKDIIQVLQFQDDVTDLKLRPPIITVMGHVDHGKTSLLDYIRSEKVADTEAGGITQHVGAYKVLVGELGLTFIDTPGHQAFTKMRGRGADVTDIVILVVASDDGVMPQTIEAINHTKAANVPMVVAINKSDLQEANPAKVKADLTKHGVVTEDLGGDIPAVEVSAKTGAGINDLLDIVSVVAEVEELKANYKASASGIIIESRIEIGKGPVATGIVTRGTLKIGDSLYAGGSSCRVRGLFTHSNEKMKEVMPGSPVEIMGWDEAPSSGDQFVVVKNHKEAKSKASKNISLLKEFISGAVTGRTRMEDMMKLLQEGEVESLNVIIKGDANGSVEAIKDGVLKLSTDEINIQIVHNAVGGIIESDIDLASATNSIVVGFNVRPDSKARNLAKNKGVSISTYDIIYELLDNISELISGKTITRTEKAVIGMVDVKTIFKAPKVGVVAGSIVTEGKVDLNSPARLLRGGMIVYEGVIISLRRFKDNVETVSEGLECGIGLLDYKDIKEGDVIEILGEVEV